MYGRGAPSDRGASGAPDRAYRNPPGCCCCWACCGALLGGPPRPSAATSSSCTSSSSSCHANHTQLAAAGLPCSTACQVTAQPCVVNTGSSHRLCRGLRLRLIQRDQEFVLVSDARSPCICSISASCQDACSCHRLCGTSTEERCVACLQAARLQRPWAVVCRVALPAAAVEAAVAQHGLRWPRQSRRIPAVGHEGVVILCFNDQSHKDCALQPQQCWHVMPQHIVCQSTSS